jgi:hypothetical protein
MTSRNSLPETLSAVRNGGFDQLEYRTDVPTPDPSPAKYSSNWRSPE